MAVFPAPTRWVANLDPGSAPRVGRAVAWLLLRMPQWVYRRVESVEFLDDLTIRRRVSVDFSLAANPGAITDASGNIVYFVPLAFMKKGRLRRFDLRDEAGDSIPLLTRRENAMVASEALVRLAEARLDRVLEDDLRADLLTICEGDPPPDAAAEEALLKRLTGATGASRVTRALIGRDELVCRFVRDLSQHFLLLVTLHSPPGGGHPRRVLKFSYDEDIPDERVGARILQSLSWQPRVARLGASGIGDCASFHMDIAAPADVEVVWNGLALGAPGEAKGAIVDQDLRRGGPRQRVHLTVVDAPARSQGAARVALRVRRLGLIRASMLTGIFVASVLTIGALRLDSINRDSATGNVATILVAIPGLLAVYLARPGEHALASRLLVGVRILVAGAAVASFAAAGSLVTAPPGRFLAIFWWLIAGYAWATALALFVSYKLPRKRATASARRWPDTLPT